MVLRIRKCVAVDLEVSVRFIKRLSRHFSLGGGGAEEADVDAVVAAAPLRVRLSS